MDNIQNFHIFEKKSVFLFRKVYKYFSISGYLYLLEIYDIYYIIIFQTYKYNNILTLYIYEIIIFKNSWFIINIIINYHVIFIRKTVESFASNNLVFINEKLGSCTSAEN